MSAQPDHTAQIMGEEIDFDAPAQKGWSFFTRFLFWNIVIAAGTLLFIGALTVWR
ncbi:MAG: hypothetical protein KGQ26_09155 [Rhodospirillales bacterium]|nr:hypothetical protein [Rhodospirillales bacterium]MDE2318841.1 hypothetical protein [Rhodospirillales bacterium]